MVLVTRRECPGCEARLVATWTELTKAAAAFPGYLGGQLIHPIDEGNSDDPLLYHMLVAFEHLRAWLQSPVRKLGLQALAPYVEGREVVREISGLEHWFTPTVGSSANAAPPPPRWKVAVVTWLGIYPSVLLLFLTIGPRLETWPLPARTAVITVLVVVLMTWVVAPRLTCWLTAWLHPLSPTTPIAASSNGIAS